MSFLSNIFGGSNDRVIADLQPIVDSINALEQEFEALSDDALKDKTSEFKSRLTADETLDDILPEAFAAVREAAKRTIKQRHFDVQLMGGATLHRGRIGEMKTGEGKTLVATLPLYLNALTEKGCHLVTPNDYLSRVGGGWMGPIYTALGLSVGVISHDFSGVYDPAFNVVPSHGDPRLDHWRPVTRREAYHADITYGTNNEFGFDYLRDNMAYSFDQVVGRVPHFAIVDEVDSILIDEARTPLIISAPDEESAEYYKTFARIVPNLKKDIDYNVDEKMKAVSITEEGIEKVEKLLGVANIYEEKGFRYVRYLEQALKAEGLYQKDRDYVVREGEVVIVDEFTGRLMPGRRWSEGLHQAVEAKEGVQVQRESRTLATITFQNLFRMYEKLAGMTGTAVTSAEEFHKVYEMDVVIIPTHHPLIRKDKADFVFRTEHGKFLATAREIKARHDLGQPVLVGTVSIEKNERLSEYLKREGVPHAMLNAKNHEEEAKIIAQAGRLGAVTMATNIAGRGVDILLGGNPQNPEEAERVRELGGLLVLGTERHEARRIDNQLRGRAGRQGDPGETHFYLSLEDDLMRIFGSDRIKSMMESFGIPEDESIENRMVTKAIESAQSKIEGFHFDARKHLLEYDDVMNKQRDYVYRLRRDVLHASSENPIAIDEKLSEAVQEVIGNLVRFHTSSDLVAEWNLSEIAETVRAIAEVPEEIMTELERIGGQEISLDERRSEIERYLIATLDRIAKDQKEKIGETSMRQAMRVVMLQSIDFLWMDHLDQMEHLRDSVRLRAYGQRDPLVEYKNESVRMFRELQSAIRSQIVNTIFKVAAAQGTGNREQRIEHRATPAPQKLIFHGAEEGSSLVTASNPAPVYQPKPKAQQIGRNDPCLCGSGKKFKRCGALNTEEHQRRMNVKV